MSKTGEQIRKDTKEMLGLAQSNLASQSEKYIDYLKKITKDTRNSFRSTESVIHAFMNDHKSLWYVFLTTLFCQVVNTIQWIAKFL